MTSKIGIAYDRGTQAETVDGLPTTSLAATGVSGAGTGPRRRRVRRLRRLRRLRDRGGVQPSAAAGPPAPLGSAHPHSASLIAGMGRDKTEPFRHRRRESEKRGCLGSVRLHDQDRPPGVGGLR